MHSKKILVLSFSLSNNGAERVFSELSNEWASMGNDVTVMQFEKDAYGGKSFHLIPEVKLLTLNKKSISNKIKRYLAYYREIKEWMKSNPDANVIAFSFTTQIIVAIASLVTKNWIVFSERNDPNSCPYNAVYRRLRTISFRRANKCVFQTEDAKKYFPKKVQDKGVIIVNPINPNLPDRHVGERRKTIVSASRLRPQKNLPMLIEAFEKLSLAHNDYTLEIFGVGEEEDRLQRMIKDRNLSGKVFLKGFAENVNELMRDVSMYVCSSDYEGISNSMLEAMGLGLPTVSTDCPIGGARQIIRNEENGLLVPVGDVQALYLSMKRIIEDQNLTYRISNNAYKIRKEYRVDAIARKWLALLH